MGIALPGRWSSLGGLAPAEVKCFETERLCHGKKAMQRHTDGDMSESEARRDADGSSRPPRRHPGKRIWITWERQRRSVELARHFGCELHEIIEVGAQRYTKSIVRTIRLLAGQRRAVVFVQNPSMILAALATLWGLLSRSRIVVDRHSTFMLNRKYPLSLGLIVFKLMHRFTLRFATLTLVTNDHLAALVRKSGGRALVLPDKLPTASAIRARTETSISPKPTFLFVCSFAEDEPLREVIDAVRLCGEPAPRLLISGNTRRADPQLLQQASEDIVFTGFLPDDQYYSTLSAVDGVIVLTTAEYTMLCGCYEAVAAQQPLITSDKKVLRDYFEGAYFVQNSPESISEAMMAIVRDRSTFVDRTIRMQHRIEHSWGDAARTLEQLVSSWEADHAQ